MIVARKQAVDKGVIMPCTIVGKSSSIKGNTNIDQKRNELKIKTPVNFRSNYFLIQRTSFCLPGAFLQSKLADDEETFIVLRGKLAALFCKTNTAKYDPHLKYDRKKNEHYIYVRLKKSLYGTL